MHTRHLRLLAAASLVVAAGLVVGLVFAGSPAKLPAGIEIEGVAVGGLTAAEALDLLEGRSEQLADVPVTFVAGTDRWEIRPRKLGVTVDWPRAVAEAQQKGDGFAVVRGYKRLGLRLFPTEIVPVVRAYDAAVAYEVGLLADAIDRPHQEARLVRHGLEFEVVPGTEGRVVDREAAARVVVDALAQFSRTPVQLPVSVDQPRLEAAQLAGPRALAELAVSAPVTLTLGSTERELSPRTLAAMLQLPDEAGEKLVLGGPAANAYFARLDRAVSTPPRDATFEVSAGRVTVIPSSPGLAVDVPRSAAKVLVAATGTGARVAPLVVAKVAPSRTTAEAKAMGITGVVSSYATEYGGVPNRIHNVQLVASLIDGALIPPGAIFSFNETTGERNAEKGFREAPVIINGELQTGIGGGVCQVSTTVFNAAYEAGLPIEARANHALYISHYPLGRDATVDYPSIDLKFRNDTDHWLLLRTFVGPSSLVVNLYGAPQNRRVVTETAPLRKLSPPPVKRKRDKTLPPGSREVESVGVPAQATSVRRLVYAPDGTLLSEGTWWSTYRAEPRIVLLGPLKKKKKPAAAVAEGKGKLSPPVTTTAPQLPR